MSGWFEWRYVQGGQVLHCIGSNVNSSRAQCGLTVWATADWFGTGSQGEYDKAASLPLCKRCAAKVAESEVAEAKR